MDLSQYLHQKNAAIPNDIEQSLLQDGGIHLTAFEQKNDILNDPELQKETGYARFANGDYLVSMYCLMPGVTREMIDWWFWWHPQNTERYQIWFPGEHFEIGYAAKDKDYFTSPVQPAFADNTQYPTELIGSTKMQLQIDFITPEEFGFDAGMLKEYQVATVVCGHVGALHNLIQHTEMAHIFFQKEDGLYLVSRFWIGKRLKNPLIRQMMLKDGTAEGVARHCCVEYRNLAAKLPDLYKEYH
jgi:hypothetical protein